MWKQEVWLVTALTTPTSSAMRRGSSSRSSHTWGCRAGRCEQIRAAVVRSPEPLCGHAHPNARPPGLDTRGGAVLRVRARWLGAGTRGDGRPSYEPKNGANAVGSAVA